MKKYKKSVIIFFILILVLTSGCIGYYLFMSDPDKYDQLIQEQDYFSFSRGYTYYVGDTIHVSKYSKHKNLIFEIKNLLTGTVINEKTSELNDDLSIHKFNEVYSGKITDSYIAIESGIFMFTLKSNGQDLYNDIIFVNRNDSNYKILIVLSDYTWYCYNEFGGRSNYRDRITPFVVKFINKFRNVDNRRLYKLSYYRPNNSNNEEIKHFKEDGYEINVNRNYNCIISELPLIKLLFQNYSNDFKIIDCREFEFGLHNFKDGLIIFNGHSEYWSERMIARLKMLKEKNNILFFSGNNMYRDVVTENEYLTVIKNKIPKDVTTKITGTYFTGNNYLDNSSFFINQPDNFLFEGINSSEMGDNWAASIETDKINEYTDEMCELLATGKSIECDLVLLTSKNKKFLLNTSSVGSYNGLKESNFRKFIMNFINFSLNKE